MRELVGAISPANAFYAGRLRSAGVDPSIGSLDEFSARMPFTVKADLVADQAAHPPFGTNLSYPLERYTRFFQTSGTTNRPLAVLDTRESYDWMLGNWNDIYRAAGVRPGQRLYFAFSFGPFLGFWTGFEAAVRHGCLSLPGGGLGTPARLRAIIEYGAEVLLCTPSYALHLGESAAEEGFDLKQSSIRKIIVAGESGGSLPATRERISAIWNGAEVLDHYGMTEVGPAAFQKAGEPDVLHLIHRSYYAEVIDTETERAVPFGAIGELVLTTLGRTACPLFRYKTGDLVRRCPEAEGTMLAGGIIGRVDDMVVVRGVNLYPSAVESIVRGIPEISEYRVRIDRHGALAEALVEVECSSAGAPEALARAFAASLSLRIPVRRVEPRSLPRSEMKSRRWLISRSDG